MMNNTLDILMLEDDELDAELNISQLHQLEEYVCKINWVQDKQGYLEALHDTSPDIILSDFSLDQYTALDAIRDLKATGKLIPLIIITGKIDEETAAGTIKSGAWDYVVKDRLFRLPLAIRSALHLKEERINSAIVEARNRQLSMALEQSPVHIVITNTGYNIVYVNSKFTEMTGFTPDEVLGKNVKMLVPDESRNDYYNIDFSITDRWEGEIQALKKGGSIFWEQISISPLKNESGEITHLIAVKQDITQRKIMERQLIEALDQAERSDKLKEAFLQNMSHEIRTPLNSIVGFSELLNSDDSISREKILHYTSVIYASSNQLLSIVSDILTISSIQTGQVSVLLELVDLNKVVDQLHEVFLQNAVDKNLELRISKEIEDQPFFTMTDETKLTQILTNLLHNAIKFTNDGYVELSYKHEGDRILFRVTDTGIGIPEDSRQVIFERFRQADSSVSSKFGGTGLGLSISKSFAEMLEGSLWVESEQGKGSSFFLSIPLRHQTQPAHEDKSDKISLPDFPLTILVAEDEINNYYLLEDLLKAGNIQILHARNGIEAVRICNDNPGIDLVLMDIKMPDMDGITAFAEIRKLRPRLPVIAQTAYALKQEKKHFLNLGFDDYIAKPIMKSELFRKISNAVKPNT
jgi:PAS domain S-box-containing protein